MNRKKKIFIIIIGLVVLVAAFYFLTHREGRMDDWVFKPSAFGGYIPIPTNDLIKILAISLSVLAAWISILAFLIVRGRPTSDEAGKLHMHPQRAAGFYWLIGLVAVSFLSIAISAVFQFIGGAIIYYYSIILLIWFVFIAKGIIAAIKNKAKIGLVPPVILTAAIAAGFFVSNTYTHDYKFTALVLSSAIGALSLVGLAFTMWLAIPIMLIVRGKASVDESGKKRMNPERSVGLFLLIGPLLLVVIVALLIFITIYTRNMIFFLVASFVPLIYIVRGLFFSIRRKVKIAIAPVVIVPMAIIFCSLAAFGVTNIIGSTFGFTPGQGTITAPTIGFGGGGGGRANPLSAPGLPGFAGGLSRPASYDRIGFSVGGAKDVNTFRDNIRNNYLPLPSSITYEGLFYDYYFDTGEQETCQKLFCPSYSYAVAKDPISNKQDVYLSVGLNSGVKESDFKRKKLNLVIVLDISGSMSSAFNEYYYDRFGNRNSFDFEGDKDADKTKMQISSLAANALLDHLGPDDRFGMVLFDENAYLAKPLNKIGDTDIEAIKGHILEIQPQGSTNMSEGMEMASKMFEEFYDADPKEYENRIILLTDAQPNTGDITEEGMVGMARRNADNKVHFTFIGIGVDFNTDLIEMLTKIRGANYYSVHSPKEFKERMDDEFEFMVTPLVFNLSLNLDARGYKIEKVYGSPEANEATGEIMKVNTLFPSRRIEEKVRGGIVLLKLKKESEDAELNLAVSYEDRDGMKDADNVSIKIPPYTEDFYQNTGARKGLLLARYADLIKNWIIDERVSKSQRNPTEPKVTPEAGIIVPEKDWVVRLGPWERQSTPLTVSDKYKQLFVAFKLYADKEISALGDETLNQEIEILKLLINK